MPSRIPARKRRRKEIRRHSPQWFVEPTRLQLNAAQGQWGPEVDQLGLGLVRTRGLIQVSWQTELQPHWFPWWLRTADWSALTVHGLTVDVEVVDMFSRGQRRIQWWAPFAPIDALRADVDRLPMTLCELLQRPNDAEERAVVRDFALHSGLATLARWLGA